MKRFVVLCAVVAVISLYVPSTWATAPAVSDLPDVRLMTGGQTAPKGVISGGLNGTEFDAYDLDDFIKDFDDDVASVTKALTSQTMINPPISQAPNSDTPVPVIQLDAENMVDIYGRVAAGWARYTAEVDDGTNPVTLTTAVAKYSTFALGTPSLTEGRFLNVDTAGWQFAYVWTGSDIVVNDLDGTIQPPTTVNWEAYFNGIDYDYDANGNLLGIDPTWVNNGSSFVANGWNVAISTTGGLTVSPGSVFSPGPFLIGILAINQSDANDIDATRVLVAEGLLGAATYGGHSAATHDKSETLDGLTPGTIPTPTAGGDTRVPIQEGSHWAYAKLAQDSIFSNAQLEIVALATSGLPAAAAAQLGSPLTAGGNGLKATLVPAASYPTGAFRLQSRVFLGIQTGEIYTFSANVATDVTTATNSPNILMGLASGLGGVAMGFNLEHFQYGSLAVGTVLEQYQRDITPLAADGWQTLSVNYTPPLSRQYFDVDADGDMDQADIDYLATTFLAQQGFSDERTAMLAAFRVATRRDMTATTHMWIDNLRVYRSAYELDMGLAKTKYYQRADITGILPPSFISQTTGDMDGSFESYAGDLSAIGFFKENGAGEADQAKRSPYGSLPSDAAYLDCSASGVTVNTSVDHTKSAGSSKCLQIALAGTDADFRNVRGWVNSAIVAVPGSGIYCAEMFMSKQRATNSLESDRTPTYTMGLLQCAPNFGVGYGAYLQYGGAPISIGEEENNWLRIVGTGYIASAQLVRVFLQVEEAFEPPTGRPASAALVTNFSVPSYFDDITIYGVDDPAKFFDADLFDGS